MSDYHDRSIDPNALDRYITGNYGEDQFALDNDGNDDNYVEYGFRCLLCYHYYTPEEIKLKYPDFDFICPVCGDIVVVEYK